MSCRVFFVGCLAVALTASAPPDEETSAPLSLCWRLVGNETDNRYEAELVLKNVSNEPLSLHWAIYFNSSGRIVTESVREPFVLKHINGDFYVLRPSSKSAPWKSGEERIVRWTGTPWAINVSDAPSGFYLVVENVHGIEQSPIPLAVKIESFPEAKLIRRGGGDELPMVTAASRFAENARLKLLPPEDLPAVVPTPVSAEFLGGKVVINSSTKIVHDPQLAAEAKFLAESFRQSFDVTLEIVSDAADRNVVRLRLDDAGQTGDEAYRLKAHPDSGIEIVGNAAAGVFYGIQTLQALVPVEVYRERPKQLTLNAVTIQDAPRFSYRGLHLDVARNFQSPETVKKLLELMSFYKLNRLHWHLTDDEGWRVEIKSLPELTAVGGRRGHTRDEHDRLNPALGSGPSSKPRDSAGSGYYTHAEFVDILRFANEHHITVIPEIDFPGHARAAIKSMEARTRTLTKSGQSGPADQYALSDTDDNSAYESVQMYRDNVVDVGRESTYRFMEVVISDLAALYRDAGLTLECVHLGGDEVPQGAWAMAPSCRSIATTNDTSLARTHKLQVHFLQRCCRLLEARGIQPACWEDCLLFAAGNERAATTKGAVDWSRRPTAYVWNNVWGWGREDTAYRLANTGYDVILCNATHLYFDLACEKDPQEPGYYWAGFVDMRTPWDFNPLDVFQNAARDSMGKRLPADQFANSVRLTETGRRHILGIQCQLWSENLRSSELLEYMAFPRMIAFAERAWAVAPSWTSIDSDDDRNAASDREWNRFANTLGQRELSRLDYLATDVAYRVPPPGAIHRDEMVLANVAFPGLTIRYTTDGTDPTPASAEYRAPIASQPEVRFKAFDTRGRGSRSAILRE